MAEWILTSERVPEFPEGKHSVYVIAFGMFNTVAPAVYSFNPWAKTARGKAPRWESCWGRLAATPTHWMPMPEPPHTVVNEI